MVVPLLAWYLRISIGCGTGNKPTSVPCCRNFRISLSSVKPLQYSQQLNHKSVKEYTYWPFYEHRKHNMVSFYCSLKCFFLFKIITKMGYFWGQVCFFSIYNFITFLGIFLIVLLNHFSFKWVNDNCFWWLW